MTTLHPYPEYKPSGAEWLGETPVHWEVLPNRAVFHEIDAKGHPHEPMLSVTIGRGVITQNSLLEDSSKKDSSNQDKSSYKLVEPGDLAYNKMRAWQGAIGLSSYRGIVSPAYIIMRPTRSQDPRFLHYLFRTPAFATEAERWSYGITSDQWSLRSEDFKQIYSPLPSLDEQRAIADFLDAMDAKITRFIAARRRMIALLEEQKGAIINQSVTRGLDPDVPLKPSRIDWLGDIPTHWDVSALRHRFSVELGKMLDTKRVTGLHLVSYLRNVDVRWGHINTVNLPEMDIHPAEYDRYTIKKGDLLVCEGGEVGRTAIWTGGQLLAYQKALHRLRPLSSRRDDPHFFYFLMKCTASRGVFAAHGNENTFNHLTGEAFRAYRFPFPPPLEQSQIADYLYREIEWHDKIASRHNREIRLMQEYRTRLISDVVTGKLDVRSVSFPELDESMNSAIEAAIASRVEG